MEVRPRNEQQIKTGICQKHPQIRFSAFLWQRLVWFQFWGWFRKFKKINWSSRPTLSLHCRFSCAVSHLSGTIHTVDQMCPDLFTPWGWNVHFRHFNREQEEYRTREKKSYKNFWTKGKLKRLRQRWGSIFAYAPLCSLCQCTCNIIFQIFCPRGFSDVRGNYNQTKLCAWKQAWGNDEGGFSSSSPLCSLCQCSRPRWMWVSPYHNLKLNDSQIGRDHLIKIF